MSVFLQIIGGLFYLLNKVFFSIAERNPNNKRWRVWSWSVYLVGLPAWVVLFIWNHNWIAAALEASGAPSMILGLTIALWGKGRKPKWLNRLAIAAIVGGIIYSLYDFGGLTTLSQFLELGIVAGFLIGTYQLAHENSKGYLWYLVMCSSTASLMWIEHYPWLVVQQVVSIGFITDSYLAHRRKISSVSAIPN